MNFQQMVSMRVGNDGEGEGISDLLYSIGVMSDLHTREAYGGIADVTRAMEYYEASEVDFVISTGDITTEEEQNLIAYKSIVDASITKPTYACRGNHDRMFTDAEWNEYIGHAPNYSFVRNDDLILILSNAYNISATDYTNTLIYAQEQVALNPGKRVLVFMHFPFYGMAGLKEGQAYGWSSSDQLQYDFYDLVSENCVFFQGHTHYLFEAEDIKDDILVQSVGSKSTVHSPSTTYPYLKDGTIDSSRSEGWVVNVYKDKIRLNGVDFITGEENPNHRYVLYVAQ